MRNFLPATNFICKLCECNVGVVEMYFQNWSSALVQPTYFLMISCKFI